MFTFIGKNQCPVSQADILFQFLSSLVI